MDGGEAEQPGTSLLSRLSLFLGDVAAVHNYKEAQVVDAGLFAGEFAYHSETLTGFLNCAVLDDIVHNRRTEDWQRLVGPPLSEEATPQELAARHTTLMPLCRWHRDMHFGARPTNTPYDIQTSVYNALAPAVWRTLAMQG